MNRVALTWALTIALAGGTLATSSSARAERPMLAGELHRLVSAGAPGAILLVRHGDRETRLASGYGDVARRIAMRPNDLSASRA